VVEELRRRRLARLSICGRPPVEEPLRRETEQQCISAARLLAVHGPAAAALVQTQHTSRTPAEEVPQCRICHGGTELGLLFSPCRCRGTTRFVHPRCLASWRTISSGSSSFASCDVCGYLYHTHRAAWAPLLESRRIQFFLAVAMTMAAIALLGCACSFLQLDVEGQFYRAVFWHPPWRAHYSAPRLQSVLARWAASCDTAVAGGVLVGVAGSVWASWRSYRAEQNFFIRHGLPSIVMTFFSSGTPALRIFVSGGIVYGVVRVHAEMQTLAKAILTRFGERVLAVEET